MSAAHWWRAWWHPTMDAVVMATKTRCSKLGCLLHWVDSIIEWDAVQQVWQLVALRSLVMLNLLRLLYAAFSVFRVSRFIFYFRRRRRYMFCSCLSVCLSVSKITQKRVHGFGWNVACRQTDVGTWTNWFLSPIRIILRMREPDCFLRYRISAAMRNFTSGKSHWRRAARASRGFKMV